MENDKFTFIQADLIEKQKILDSIEGHDVVFHIAANPDVRLGAQEPSIAKKDILATYYLLEVIREKQIKQIVFSSSSTIYGETQPFPLPGDYGPFLPISVYGR